MLRGAHTYGVGARFVSETAHLKIYSGFVAITAPCRVGRHALERLVATHNFSEFLIFLWLSTTQVKTSDFGVKGGRNESGPCLTYVKLHVHSLGSAPTRVLVHNAQMKHPFEPAGSCSLSVTTTSALRHYQRTRLELGTAGTTYVDAIDCL